MASLADAASTSSLKRYLGIVLLVGPADNAQHPVGAALNGVFLATLWLPGDHRPAVARAHLSSLQHGHQALVGRRLQLAVIGGPGPRVLAICDQFLGVVSQLNAGWAGNAEGGLQGG